MPDPNAHPIVQALDEAIDALTYLRESGTKVLPVTPEVWAEFVRPTPEITAARAMPTLPEPANASRSQQHSEQYQALMTQLRQTIAQCQKCPYAAGTRVEGRGPVYHPEVAIINGANMTGDSAMAQHARLEGDAAGLLEKMFTAIGLHTEQLYITPAMKCPVARKPSSDALTLCTSYLREELAIIKPKVVVLLGPTAAKALFVSGVAATGKVGQWNLLSVGKATLPTITLHHPARILMLDEPLAVSLKRENWAALQALRARLQA